MTILSPATIAKSLERVARLPAPPRSLVLAERTGGLRLIGEVASDTAEARRAAELLKTANNDVRAFDIAEWGIRTGAGVAEPSMMVLRLLSMGRSLRASKFAAALSDSDKMFVMSGLFKCILTQSERGVKEALSMASTNVLNGYISQAAGLMREVYGRNLQTIAGVVENLREEVSAMTRHSPELAVIDSSLVGQVRLPTRLREGERSLELGTDRIVGVGRRSIGYPEGLRVEGELTPRILCEVKARTTAHGGISQVVKFQLRGNRGYIQIGDELWLLKDSRLDYLTNFVVAPAGQSLRLARREAAELSQLGIRIRTLELPADVETEIMVAARNLVNDIATHARAKP